ncbi:hypothetical protein NPIL_292581 [Nephila pilipes]|uniref:Uncharacterized protein n=1 Tax=Nephila pilipes TaxID=299642 RepID=A0A8X6MDV7_NEPPI|nr:hypothetical protein NPIL_292581 [Nephila pilipes]
MTDDVYESGDDLVTDAIRWQPWTAILRDNSASLIGITYDWGRQIPFTSRKRPDLPRLASTNMLCKVLGRFFVVTCLSGSLSNLICLGRVWMFL